MDSEFEERGDVIVVRVKGRLDAASTPQLENRLNSLIESGHFKLVFNLGEVDYLSSAGMRLLLSTSKKLKALEGKVLVCNLNEDLMKVIHMAGFTHVIEIYPSESESFAHL